MVLYPEVIGQYTPPVRTSWTADDVMLYALSVGAGQEPLQELAFTTENTAGVELRALPSFASIVGQRSILPNYGDFDRSKLVHAEQSIELHRPLPAAGSIELTSAIEAMHDKGKAAVVWLRVEATDAETGAPLFTNRAATFIHGEGGFGGPRGTTQPWEQPQREPDFRQTYTTRPEQALLYRLNSDRNPLHADPSFAVRAGYDRPILHGLCTYGFSVRAILGTVLDGDPDRIASMTGRFSAPMWPGESLEVDIWVGGLTVWFRTLAAGDRPVIERGRVTLNP